MKTRFSITCLLAIAALGGLATTVRAQNPHFLKASATLKGTGSYCVSFKEVGLGNSAITYQITADATFTYQCFTKSGNEPQGDPNSVSYSDLTAQTTLTPRNGQITGTLCLDPRQDGAGCQGKGLELRLIGVSYENVTLCDTTTQPNVCVDLPNLHNP